MSLNGSKSDHLFQRTLCHHSLQMLLYCQHKFKKPHQNGCETVVKKQRCLIYLDQGYCKALCYSGETELENC